MEIIKSLEKISFDTLFESFNEAFGEYEIRFNKVEVNAMLQRRGFVPELSFGAFDGDKLVSFTFNGVGTYNGIKTAYDTGTGTIKEYGGRGLATKVFMHSIPYLKRANISRYLLEVLQHNTKAVGVYRKIGFSVTREFNYFIQKNENIVLKSKPVPSNFIVQATDLSLKESMMECWDFIPSWQNSFESIERSLKDFIILGMFINRNLSGYCIFEPNTGDVAQIAVNKEHRRKGIASALLKEILAFNRHHSVKAINTQVDCESITGFLQSNSIALKGKQFEMMRDFHISFNQF